jgi:2-keto-4-pentenoate hydratase/2-oxohepta-3-ene-1,7-dioic acid hydratase in catechol pathway
VKLVTFSPPEQGRRVGAIVDDHVIDLLALSGDDPAFATMVGLLAAGPSSLGWATNLCAEFAAPVSTGLGRDRTNETGPWYPLSSVSLAAPIPRPAKNVFCVGLNYRSHVEQNAIALGQPIEIPTIPLFFSKPVTAVIGPGDAVVYDPRLTNKLDFEVELAVVIGKQGTWIAPEDVYEHIFGFTIVNDVSARDLQWRTSQFFYGKGLDSYCPMGPAIVTKDEMPLLAEVQLELRVNGELRQSEPAGNMLFPPELAIAELSKGITLEPGDVISLGTPGGCGYQSVPPRFLRPGDVIECRAGPIGALQNHVVDVTGDGPSNKSEVHP